MSPGFPLHCLSCSFSPIFLPSFIHAVVLTNVLRMLPGMAVDLGI